jgi:hypothetical protein
MFLFIFVFLLCMFVFYFLYFVCIFPPFLYIAVPFLFLFKFIDHCCWVEIQMQSINIISCDDCINSNKCIIDILLHACLAHNSQFFRINLFFNLCMFYNVAGCML